MANIKIQNKVASDDLQTLVKSIQYWYYRKNGDQLWPINEIVYSACSILKEVAQGLNGDNFSVEYLREKTTTIINFAIEATDGVID